MKVRLLSLTEFRLIGSLAGTIFGKDVGPVADPDAAIAGSAAARANADNKVTYTYTLDLSAAEVFKAVGSKSDYEGQIIAVGVNKPGVGLVAGPGTGTGVKISN